MGLTGGVVLLALQVSLLQPAAPTQAGPTRRQLSGTPWTVRIGPQRPDLVRYNRVEALSLGLRAQIRPNTPIGALSVSGTMRFGSADRHLNGRLDIAHETVARRIVLSGYHELTAIDERARHFGVANSAMALLMGQDDGDYYRRSGATVEWTPPTARARTFRFRAFAEHHQGVGKETDVQLQRLWDDGASFRPNIAADDAWEYGGSLELGKRMGTDPRRTRGGVEGFVQAAGGDVEYARASLGVDMALTLPARLTLTLEAAGGTSWGSPSVQRLWYVGGPLTLRGYDPRAAGGETFGRGRVEVDRSFSFGRFVLFSDVGWAGDRSDIDLDNALSSAGAGLAVIDGILRIDGGWQLESPHDFRLDVYLDQIL
jgi:hypothetical protein